MKNLLFSTSLGCFNRLPLGLLPLTLVAVLGFAAKAQAVAFSGQVLDFQEKQIYHSPETPGYTSWVGLWQLPSGEVRCDFRQVTGPANSPVSSIPVLRTKNSGATWDVLTTGSGASDPSQWGGYTVSTEACRGMAVLPDGTLVRPVWPSSDLSKCGYVVRSTDGGTTWSNPINFVAPEAYRAWPTLIKPLSDGRLVLMAGCWQRGDTTNGARYDYPAGYEGMLPNMAKMMFVSSDGGRTWGNPINILPASAGVCEESDFVELPNGDLMWIHRSEHYPDHAATMSPLGAPMGSSPPESYWYSDRMQTIMHKQGDTFVAGEYGVAAFPHSGFPCELMTREGVILDLCTTGSHWSNDNGATWHDLKVDGASLGSYYYPKALQTDDGTIIVVGHRGSDDVYGTVDQAIMCQTFRLSEVPEPSPLVLLGTAVVGLLGYALRRCRVRMGSLAVRTALAIVGVFLAGTFAQAAKPQNDSHVQAVEFSERIIYHSPEKPGYTSWVGFWQLPNGTLRCDCRQVTGPKDKPVSSVPVLESKDGAVTWTVLTGGTGSVDPGTGGGYALAADSCRGMAVLPNGTLVRPCWPSQMKDSGFLRRSTDGGKTWSDKIYFLPPDEYRTWPTLIQRLRDGRLVLFAGCWKRGDTSCGNRTDAIFADGLGGMLPNMTKMMFVSADEGKTWSKPIVLMPTAVGVCEESDFCELPNGDLFWIHRTEHYPDHQTQIPPMAARMGDKPPDSYWYSDRMQNIVRKRGDTFVPGKCTPSPFYHSGYPSVLLTREGAILHLATGESHWTMDLGKTWHKLQVDGKPLATHYYPKSLQLADGRIVCIGHRGADDVYGTVDQAVVQQTFRLKVQK